MAVVQFLKRGLARYRGGLALLAGACLPLSFAPFGLFPVAVLAIAALFALWEGASPRLAGRYGFLFGVGAFLAGLYWLYISLYVFGKAPLWVAVPLMLILVAILAAYVAALGYLSARWLRGTGSGRWLLTLPAAWVLVEWLRGWLFGGFSWLSLGYSQTDSPLAGWAPVLGVHGVSWMVSLSAGALVAVAWAKGPARIAAAALIVVIWAGGGALGTVTWVQPAGPPLTASLVQAGISQDRKWLDEQFLATLTLYRRRTLENLDSDLVVWPEVAIPARLHEVRDYLDDIQAAAQAQGVDLVLGALRYDAETGRAYNGMLALGSGATFYAKRHLVPFGEYFPVPDFVRKWLRLMSLPHSDFTPGERRQPLLQAAGHGIAPSVCYEDAFGAELLDFLPEATLLVNVSNDAWFGDSIAPHQHLQIARMRSIETGRYMLRATNNGISAVIAEDGTVVRHSPQFVEHVLRAEAQPLSGATPYVRWGNWAAILGAALALVAGGALARRNQL